MFVTLYRGPQPSPLLWQSLLFSFLWPIDAASMKAFRPGKCPRSFPIMGSVVADVTGQLLDHLWYMKCKGTASGLQRTPAVRDERASPFPAVRVGGSSVSSRFSLFPEHIFNIHG